MTREEAQIKAKEFGLTLYWEDMELISLVNSDGRTRTITDVLPAPKDYIQRQNFLNEFVKYERPLDKILNNFAGMEFDIYLLFARLNEHESWRFEPTTKYYNY